MNLRTIARQLPLRLTAGSYVLNSGLSKWCRTRRLLRRADRPLPAHPRMRQEGSVRPTEQGIPLAKDIWLLGIGTSLVVDDLVAKNRTEGKQS